SQGVPVIACECAVCKSEDPKDKRLRVSVLIEVNGLDILVDSGPDFRQQMLRENVQKLDAILFTHEHKDHTAGLDDVRAFNFKYKKDMDVYAHPRVQEALKMEFSYIFAEFTYTGVPKVQLHNISKERAFTIESKVEVTPIEVLHYKLPVLGFRIENFTYITDAKTISPEEKDKIRGTEVLVLNALHRKDHISHFNLQEALDLIVEIKPKKAYLTHISHLFDRHEDILRDLPENVFVAFDGLKIEL
ncbi:MAG TPA: MBL fold metallo-hydrolase, partial [Flavobacteriales bacterium]|nr:MBL fold metallo-hydrolase [Flavobacteriales bacterium]